MPPQVVRAGSPTAGRALEGQLSLDAFLVPLPSAPLFNVNTWVVINFFFYVSQHPIHSGFNQKPYHTWSVSLEGSLLHG